MKTTTLVLACLTALASGSMAQTTGAAAGPSDSPLQVLSHPDSPWSAFLKAYPTATELVHQQGQLNFVKPDHTRTAILGSVTHRDSVSGKWVPNDAVLSSTANGWRLDGTANSLLIRSAGPNHTVTQSFFDYATKHTSTLVLTVPTLTYNNVFGFRFVQDGLTWDLVADSAGVIDFQAIVPSKRGSRTYSFPLSSSEALSVDAGGGLSGGPHVHLSRAKMIPKSGAAVSCSTWSLSQGIVSFTCDDTSFRTSQLPYRIDPSSATLTDGGSYNISANDDFNGVCYDDNGNITPEYDCEETGNTPAIVNFNTSGLLPLGSTLVSTPCSYTTWSNPPPIACSTSAFNNSGTTSVTVAINDTSVPYNDSTTVWNVTLTVNFNFTLADVGSVSPASGSAGTAVTISGAAGSNYGASQGGSTVTFNGIPAAVLSWSPSSIVAIVPPGATSGNVQVTIGGWAGAGAAFTVTSDSSSCTAPPNYQYGLSAPSTVYAGSVVPFSVVMWNNGSSTWSTSGSNAYFLGISPWNPIGDGVPHSGDASDFGNMIQIAGGTTQPFFTATFNGANASLPVKAPAVPGLYTFAWSMFKQGGPYLNAFGTCSQQINVIPPPPTITGLTPASGPVGTAITISGTYFLSSLGTVAFNGVTAQPTSWSNTSITVPVPAGATTGNVVVTAAGLASNGFTFTVPPSISSLSYTSAPLGAAVTLTGTNFGATQGGSTVKFNGTAATATAWSANSITVVVPSGATSGSVIVTVGGYVSNGVGFNVILAATITGLSAPAAPPGATLTIAGANFGASQGSSFVTINGTAATVSSWTTTAIGVIVPSAQSNGNVVVTVSGWPSTGVAFTVTGTVAMPVLSPPGGIYTAQQSVTMTTTTPGASIRYTTDGSTPSETNGTLYSAPLTLTSQTTPLQAIAYLTYWSDSAIASATYYSTSPTGGNGSGGPGAGTPDADSGNGLDPRRVGVRSFGSYWGAAGEQIDTTSLNLNYSLPLLKVLSRGGWSVGVMLNYNSQMWRRDSAGTWLMGYDVGYGVGWQLQIGSLTAVYGAASQLDHYLYTDTTGGEYSLSVNTGGVWTSVEGTDMSYDSNTNRIYATDGSFRVMGCVSSGGEQDAGTRYPTQIEDSNGNQIFIQYGPGGGSGGAANTSARIQAIYDPRASGTYLGELRSPTYTFTYNTDFIPHLISISGQPGESYTFSLASQTLTSPLVDSSSFGTVTVLQAVTPVGLPTSYAFTYAVSGEMLSMTTPLGGNLGWTYGNCDYSGGIVQREVKSRTLSDFANSAFTNTWNFTTRDGCFGSLPFHAMTTVTDVGVGTGKAYSAGMPITGYVVPLAYQENFRGGRFSDLTKSFGWIQDGYGNVYMNSVTTTLFPGAIQAMSVQTLDAYGNLTQSQVYDYGNLTTPARTYNNSYLSDPNYTSRYIRNRLTQATVTTGGSTIYLVGANYYDGNRPQGITQPPYCNNNTSPDPSSYGPIPMHDDANYGTGFTYRGNVTYSSTYNGTNCSVYQSTGVVVLMQDGTGKTITTSPTAGNYSLPSVLTPNGNSSLATSITYSSSWAVTGVTAPNGASATTIYDALGRPVSSTSSDGAVTSYGYTYTRSGSSQTNIQTATICYTTSSTSSSGCTTNAASNGTQWKQTYLDGFGRSLKVISGHDGTPVSEVDTTYGACACSPLGKMSAVSMPYAPGGSSVSTTYTYDGSGRILTVTKPDLVSKTTYAYSGNNTTTTDPAGSWKTNTTDAFGNLTVVTEPDPNNLSGGTLVTNYTYNGVNQLIQVSMPRSNGTQLRTFQWGGGDLTSATNPENGTVSYQYDGAHHVTLRTDAKGQQTHYSYDAYGRLTSVAHGSGSPDVNYYYDANPFDSSFSQSTWGRLAAVTFGGMNFLYNKTHAGTGDETDYYESLTPVYMYSYNAAGRVTGQRFQITQNFTGDPGSTVINNFDAAYSWDNQGRMTARNGPDANYSYTYDNMGRLSTMTGGANASAQYNAAGQITSMAYDSFTEARSYNNLMQLTGLTTSQAGVGNVMDMQYFYSATQNNGRIVKSVDGIAGETVNYSYDGLNRLSTAGTTGGSWLQQYTYDGFGNLTGMNGAAVNAFDPATNHPAGGYYDANGLQMGYRWDMENRLTTDASGKMFGYDHQGKRVFQVVPNPSTYTPAVNGYFYSISGQKLATIQCTSTCSISSANVYFAGKVIRSNGVTVATDRLGSVRANVNGERMSYYPYGQERTSTADGREKFGTYFRDGPGQDYADQRYYNANTGSFWTPDPTGMGIAANNFVPSIGAVDTKTPLSWNRYIYSLDDPINKLDPSGLDCITDENGRYFDDGTGGGCPVAGQYAINTNTGATFSVAVSTCPEGREIINGVCDVPITVNTDFVNAMQQYLSTSSLQEVIGCSAGLGYGMGFVAAGAAATLGAGAVAEIGQAVVSVNALGTGTAAGIAQGGNIAAGTIAVAITIWSCT